MVPMHLVSDEKVLEKYLKNASAEISKHALMIALREHAPA
jgi:hypothetical protein